MAVTRAGVMKGFHDKSRQMGDKRIAADYSFQIDGFENEWLLCKGMFWPDLTAGEGIEVPTALGGAMWQPSQVKFHQQSQVTFQETTAGHIQKLFDALLLNKQTISGFNQESGASRFNAWIYYGTPMDYIQRARIRDAFLTAEPIEVDWENRTQLVTVTATVYYHFYGEYQGNGRITGVRGRGPNRNTVKGAVSGLSNNV